MFPDINVTILWNLCLMFKTQIPKMKIFFLLIADCEIHSLVPIASSNINDSVWMLDARKDWNIWKYLGYCLHANFVLSKVRQFEGTVCTILKFYSNHLSAPALKAVERQSASNETFFSQIYQNSTFVRDTLWCDPWWTVHRFLDLFHNRIFKHTGRTRH